MWPIVADRVALSVKLVSPAKTHEAIEMLFQLWTLVGPCNHILDGVQIPLWKAAIFRGQGHPIVKYRETLWSPGQQVIKVI